MNWLTTLMVSMLILGSSVGAIKGIITEGEMAITSAVIYGCYIIADEISKAKGKLP